MLIDFRKPLLDFAGEPITWRVELRDKKTDEVLKPTVVLTLLIACQEALGGGYADEATTLSQDEKNKRFMLGLRISGESPVEITAEESGDILRLVHKAFPGSLVYPRASQIINAASKATDAKPSDCAVTTELSERDRKLAGGTAAS